MTILLFLVLVIVRRFNRFVTTGLLNMGIGRFTINFNPQLFNFGNGRAGCSIGLVPLNKCYTVRNRSTSDNSDHTFYGGTT